MDDDNELGEVRESLIAEGDGLTGVHMDRPAQAVMARGQTLRLRRRLLRGLSGVTAAGTAMALALTLPGGAAASFRQVHVNETDWSVNTGRHGAVYVMVKAVPDPHRLQYTLSLAGVQAEVHWGENCLTSVASLPSLSVVAPTFRPLPLVQKGSAPAWRTFTIHPALRPAHTHFVLGWAVSKQLRTRYITWTVVPVATHVTCTPLSIFAAHWAGRRAACTAAERLAPSPLATPSPGTTASPHATPSPNTTASPHASSSPDTTASPYASPSPDSSSSPDSSPSPHASPSPSASPSPACFPSAHAPHHRNSG